jgi:anaerobic magnesium-protoporphyrin IX monomethyl ester cyclase
VGEAPDRIVREKRVARLGLATEDIVARIHPDTQVVGIGAMFTYQWDVVKELIHALKRVRPDVLIVGGGEHFTGLPDESLQTSPVDVLVLGEGEETFVALLAAYQAFLAGRAGDPGDTARNVALWALDMPGLSFRTYGAENGPPTIQHNPRRNRIRGVDEIPLPAWDLFDVTGYDDRRLINGVRLGRTMPILATRGCPYQCTYCSSPNMWTTRWVARDPKRVADEIQGYVETFGAKNFPFQDLTAIMKRKWVVDFCKELIDRKLDITWQMPTGTRCEVVDDEVAELLRLSGGVSLNFAPESGSARVREKVSKQMTAESLFGAVEAAVRQKLNVTIFFVLGFPGDTVEDLRETAQWAAKLAKLGVEDIAPGFYFPIPGTKLFRELQAKGKADLTEDLILSPIFVQDRWLTEDRNFSETLSARTLTIWRYRIIWAFYSRAILTNPKRLWRLFTNFWSGREESKFDSFLQILKERFVTRRAVKVQDAKPTEPVDPSQQAA